MAAKDSTAPDLSWMALPEPAIPASAPRGSLEPRERPDAVPRGSLGPQERPDAVPSESHRRARGLTKATPIRKAVW
jgi:hypothetical protein